MAKREQQDIGEDAKRVIGFFEGTAFKILAGILALAGIAYALFSGGIPTSRVPAPNEQIGVQLRPEAANMQPAAQTPGADDRGGSAQGRFDAYQQRGDQ